MSPRRRRAGKRRPTRSLVLERLLVEAAQQTGDLRPPCHRSASWALMYERGGLLHLHCSLCAQHALTVEIR